jgi:hypothetical protein
MRSTSRPSGVPKLQCQHVWDGPDYVNMDEDSRRIKSEYGIGQCATGKGVSQNYGEAKFRGGARPEKPRSLRCFYC